MNKWHYAVAVRWIAAWVCLTIVACATREPPSRPDDFVFTIADVQAIHHTVTLHHADGTTETVTGQTRLGVNDQVSTSEHGRTRVQLDNGTLLVLDGNSKVKLGAGEVVVDQGRVYLEAPVAAQTQVTLGDVAGVLSGSSVSLENRDGNTAVYCGNGEIVLVRAGVQTRLTSGETARVDGAMTRVVAEKAFEDWTGGLATPWTNEVGSRSSIPEVRAVTRDTDPGTPLVIRTHDVRAKVQGEVATTKTRTTYFNGGATAETRIQLALPNGAILIRVAKTTSEDVTEARVAISDGPSLTQSNLAAGLEWAGDGYSSGSLGTVASGAVLTLELEYVEWLPTGNTPTTRTYRYLMQSHPALPPVGTLSIEVENTELAATWVNFNTATTLSETNTLLYRQTDVRPTADFVAAFAHAHKSGVRAYVTEPVAGASDDEASAANAPYVMLRTDLPAQLPTGLTLALVLDTSMSAGGAAFDAARAVVEAVLQSLSPDDEVIVFVADQTTRPLRNNEPQSVTPALRDELRIALSGLGASGASDIGTALQRAADALDSPSRGDKAGEGLVVYIGDGRPTLGLSDVSEVRHALSRRTSGSPRLFAVAVGQAADRWALARLTAGNGEVYEVLDRSEAAKVGAQLLSTALQPTWRDVTLELGSALDRVYPRNPRAVIQGSTVTVVGRLREELPAHIGLQFRKGATLTTEALPVHSLVVPQFADLPQRWALARVEDIAGGESAIQPAIALAADAKLLTPWTGWFFSAPGQGSLRTSNERILTLSSTHDTAYGGHVDPVVSPGMLLLDQTRPASFRVSLADAAESAVRRVLNRATGQVRACRQARVGAKPDVGRQFGIDVAVDARGYTTRIKVRTHDAARPDRLLERCIEGVLKGLPHVAAGVAVNLNHTITVPGDSSPKLTTCSDASRISLPLRRNIWRSRLISSDAYLVALRSCEVPRWRDKRAYLDLFLEDQFYTAARLEIAAELADGDQADAAVYLKREAMRRIVNFDELRAIPTQLLENEPALPNEFDKAYLRATTDTARLEVVRRFLPLTPHNIVLRKRLLLLLENLGQTQELLAVIRTIRGEAIIDAGLLAAGASALRRVGHREEGGQIFGELLERAPGDPWTLAYVGDRLRAESLFDEASVVYEQLARATPHDAGAHLRLALAHAGAGRLDVATRLLQTVAQTGGRDDNGRLGALSAIVQGVLVADALSKTSGPAASSATAELTRRLEQTPLPEASGFLLIVSPPSDNPVTMELIYDTDTRRAPDLDASPLGVIGALIERGAGSLQLRLRRAVATEPAHDVAATAYLLTAQSHGAPTLQQRTIAIPVTDTPVTLGVTEGVLQ